MIKRHLKKLKRWLKEHKKRCDQCVHCDVAKFDIGMLLLKREEHHGDRRAIPRVEMSEPSNFR